MWTTISLLSTREGDVSSFSCNTLLKIIFAYDLGGLFLAFLIFERLCFSLSLRSLEPGPGCVLRREGGFSAALRIREKSLALASLRFCSWLRNRRASMTIIPSSFILFPASCMSLFRTSSGMEGERAASKQSFTAVEALSACCPPGPELRIKSSRSSFSSITIDWLIRSISFTFGLEYSLNLSKKRIKIKRFPA